MESSSKVVARKQDIKNLDKCKDIQVHIKNDTCNMIKEIDLSHNIIR